MERIRDPEKLKALLDRSGVGQYFDTPGLEFEGFRYRKGEFLSVPDDPDQYLQMIVKGNVSVYFIREDGSSYSLGFNEGRFLLGDMQFFSKDDGMPCYAEAVTDVECLALSMARYRGILQQDRRFLYLAGSVVAEKLRDLSFKVAESQTLEERLVNHLRYYCPGAEMNGLERTAFSLHCSSRQLQRVLNRLEERQTVERCGKGRYRLIRTDLR